MRRMLVAIAALLFVAAVVLIGLGLIDYGDWAKPSIASVWAGIDTNSLVGFGALIEQKVDQDLWLDVVLPFLTWPAWSLPAIVGLIVGGIALLIRPRRHDRETEARPA